VSEAAAEKKAGAPLIVGRYALFDELAAGGMATVHLARLLLNDGSGRTVAVKRLHPQYTKDNEFCAMFMDEARLVTRIKHPNCVRTVDVVQNDEGLFLVMEYVHGESLSRLMRTSRERKEPIAPQLVATLVHNALLGLHAAHEVTGDDGKPLNVVHRDVSPQNIIVGVDGAAKVLDFGIAKAAGRMQTTREGQIKGKLAYMAPEQIRGQVDRRTDVFAAAVCLWEALAGRRLHEGLKDVEIVTRVVQGKFVGPSSCATGISPELDQIVLKGLAADPKKRYLTANDMAADIEAKIGLVDRAEVTAWLEKLAKPTLDKRAAKVAAMEKASRDLRPSSMGLRMPSTPDAFPPMSAMEAASGPRSERDVQAELDSVAPTTPPPYTPRPEIVAAALGTARRSAAAKPPPAKDATGPSPKTDHPAASSQSLRVATPVLPMSPVRLPAAPAAVTDATPAHVNAPVGAPVPDVPATPPGPNDTGHSQITPSGTELFLAAAHDPHAQSTGRRPLIYILLAASMLLALAGAGLGGYALARRGQPLPDSSPNVTPTNPNVTTPPVPSPPIDSTPPPASAKAKSAPPKASASTSVPSAQPTTTNDVEDPAGSASAATTSNTSNASNGSNTSNTSNPRKPVAKPAAATCDPPYVVDEAGNKKFKPECMGL
jgi:eukaryotic-like serine/threonine-protein kinase